MISGTYRYQGIYRDITTIVPLDQMRYLGPSRRPHIHSYIYEGYGHIGQYPLSPPIWGWGGVFSVLVSFLK